ncbi:MAG: ribonuclease HI, partial [Gammaproteobacteria bacterium]
CRGNPGIGGWGVYIEYGETTKELYGGDKLTTNNKMELTAAIKGLEALNTKCQVNLITDSKYVMDGINGWINGWKKNNWKNSQKKDVKNKDLWIQLDKLNSYHDVKWSWVKGHSGHFQNEKADQLANKGIDTL